MNTRGIYNAILLPILTAKKQNNYIHYTASGKTEDQHYQKCIGSHNIIMTVGTEILGCCGITVIIAALHFPTFISTPFHHF